MSTTNKPTHTSNRTSLLAWLVALLLLALGLGIRLYDLTDEPLDFHPTRQLRGAIIARGIYYEMLPDADPLQKKLATRFGASTGQYEPPILETMVAYAYKMNGEEQAWIAKIFSSSFWVIGGIALFALAYHMFSPGAALIALAYYLVLPFSTQASRSFQPDPGMVMWMMLSVYSLYRWSKKPNWKWAILAGLFGGIAILVKPVAVYIVAAVALVAVLNALGFKKGVLNLQAWAIAILMATPSTLYYLVQYQGRASSYFASWTLALSHLIVDPFFYIRWFNLIQNLMGLIPLLLALTGVLITEHKDRYFLLSLWIGYFIYGLTVPYQMYSHTYYHLQLVPILALSLVPIAQVVLARLNQQKLIWRILFLGIVVVGVAFPAWTTIQTFQSEDYRDEPAHWAHIGSLLPTDGKILALTQDYGYRFLYYGWRRVTLWRPVGEQELADLRGRGKEFSDSFDSKIEGKDYFLITAFNQFEKQPELQEILYQGYPILAEGNGYIIFDLTRSLEP